MVKKVKSFMEASCVISLALFLRPTPSVMSGASKDERNCSNMLSSYDQSLLCQTEGSTPVASGRVNDAFSFL